MKQLELVKMHGDRLNPIYLCLSAKLARYNKEITRSIRPMYHQAAAALILAVILLQKTTNPFQSDMSSPLLSNTQLSQVSMCSSDSWLSSVQYLKDKALKDLLLFTLTLQWISPCISSIPCCWVVTCKPGRRCQAGLQTICLPLSYCSVPPLSSPICCSI